VDDSVITMDWDQLELFPDVTLKPTIAMQRGESFVFQCDQCGTLLCIPSSSTRSTLIRQVKRELGSCPRCGKPKWSHVELGVGPFHPREA
jgi:ribosomal protein L37AE/L43A